MRIKLILTVLCLPLACLDAQRVDEILEAHYQAAGQEKMGKIETIVTYGKNRYSMAGIESSFILYRARPDKIRVESQFQGSSVIQAFNGERGWMVAPSMGIPEPKEMTTNELKSLLNQAEFENPLWNFEEKGSKLELIDSDPDDPADHLKLTTANGDVLHFFIDRKSHLISSIRTTQVMGGSETEITSVLQNYKSTRGIPVARSIQTRMNGETVTTIEIEKVEFNKKIDSTLFEKPVMIPSLPPGSE
jgi:outer membrane lipoprotein-sorting protein